MALSPQKKWAFLIAAITVVLACVVWVRSKTQVEGPGSESRKIFYPLEFNEEVGRFSLVAVDYQRQVLAFWHYGTMGMDGIVPDTGLDQRVRVHKMGTPGRDTSISDPMIVNRMHFDSSGTLWIESSGEKIYESHAPRWELTPTAQSGSLLIVQGEACVATKVASELAVLRLRDLNIIAKFQTLDSEDDCMVGVSSDGNQLWRSTHSRISTVDVGRGVMGEFSVSVDSSARTEALVVLDVSLDGTNVICLSGEGAAKRLFVYSKTGGSIQIVSRTMVWDAQFATNDKVLVAGSGSLSAIDLSTGACFETSYIRELKGISSRGRGIWFDANEDWLLIERGEKIAMLLQLGSALAGRTPSRELRIVRE